MLDLLTQEIDWERARVRHDPGPLLNHFYRWQAEWRLNYFPPPLDQWLTENMGCKFSATKTRTPRKGDWVEFDHKGGYIAFVNTEQVGVIFSGELEYLERDWFSQNYIDKGGKTNWHLGSF